MTAGAMNSTATTDWHGNFSAVVDSAVTNETVIQEFRRFLHDRSMSLMCVLSMCDPNQIQDDLKTQNLGLTALVRHHTQRLVLK